MNLAAYVPFVLIPFIGWGVRHHLRRRGEDTPLKRVTLWIGISAYFLTEIARSFYRPYVYANNIDDWLIADTIGNSLGTVTAIFMILTMAGRGTHSDWRLVGMVFFGLVGYELMALVDDHALDVNDLWATVIFTGLSALAYAVILSRNGKPAEDATDRSNPM